MRLIYPTTKNKLTQENSKLTIPRIKFRQIPVARMKCPKVLIFNFILYYDQQMQNYLKLSHSHMFRHYRVILRELVINALPGYTSISNAAAGNTVYN